MRRTISLAAAATFLAGASQAALYSEGFTITGTVDVTTSTVGWIGYYGSTATVSTATTSGARVAIGWKNGSGGTPGYLYATGGGNPYFAFDNTGFSIDPGDITTITFDHSSASAVNTRLAIQQDGNWYVTTAAFVSTSDTPTAAELESFTFTLDAAAWQNLNFTAGSSLALGTTLTTDLSASDPITSIGFFTDSNATARWDDLTINTVPEPSAALLSALGGLALLRRKR